MSRFCSARLLRPLTALGQASARASTSRVLLSSAPRHLPTASTHHLVVAQAARGYGHASLTTEYEDVRGLQDEDMEEDRSHWIRFPKRRQPRPKIIIRNFDPAKATLADIQQLMEPFGEIKQMNMHGKSVCYVEFASLLSAKRAVYKHKSLPFTLHDQPLYVNFAVDVVQVGKPTNALWVTGLDTSSRIDLHELKEIFEQFGEVENIILNRKGLPTCVVRYTCIEDAEYAIQRHRRKLVRHRGLALQLRYSDSRPSEARQPNPTLHVMGFCGDQGKLLSYVSGYVDKVKDVYLSSPIGEEQERRDVFITFDSTETARNASELLNRQLGLVAQFAWPKKPRD